MCYAIILLCFENSYPTEYLNSESSDGQLEVDYCLTTVLESDK